LFLFGLVFVVATRHYSPNIASVSGLPIIDCPFDVL